MEAEILHNFEVAFWAGFGLSSLMQIVVVFFVLLWRRC